MQESHRNVNTVWWEDIGKGMVDMVLKSNLTHPYKTRLKKIEWIPIN
jgi:hypothetical protein